MIVIYFIISIVINIILIVGLYQKRSNLICKSKKRLDGKTVLITGGTSGIGLKIATDFAERGARVIVACPFVDEGTRGKQIIIERSGNEDVVFKLLDLSSLESIRKFAKEINETEKRVDILVNNAGVGIVGDFYTKDGINFILQVNYFGHFLLTILLLPTLRKTGSDLEPARILNISSILHLIGTVNIDKINSLNYWYLLQLYGNSKLFMHLFTHELAKKLKGSSIVVNSVNPGLVGTPIYNCVGFVIGWVVMVLLNNFFKTPWEGAQTAIHVALDKKAGTVSGQFFTNCKLSRAKKLAYDDNASQKLWKESIKLVGLDYDEVNQSFEIDRVS